MFSTLICIIPVRTVTSTWAAPFYACPPCRRRDVGHFPRCQQLLGFQHFEKNVRQNRRVNQKETPFAHIVPPSSTFVSETRIIIPRVYASCKQKCLICPPWTHFLAFVTSFNQNLFFIFGAMTYCKIQDDLPKRFPACVCPIRTEAFSSQKHCTIKFYGKPRAVRLSRNLP